LRVVIIAAGGYGALLSVIVPSSRKVALRIDADGITLGGSPMRYKATTRVVEWREVQRVDDARLSDAVAHYAPTVSIVNLG
jgi:hypothetical protein